MAKRTVKVGQKGGRGETGSPLDWLQGATVVPNKGSNENDEIQENNISEIRQIIRKNWGGKPENIADLISDLTDNLNGNRLARVAEIIYETITENYKSNATTKKATAAAETNACNKIDKIFSLVPNLIFFTREAYEKRENSSEFIVNDRLSESDALEKILYTKPNTAGYSERQKININTELASLTSDVGLESAAAIMMIRLGKAGWSKESALVHIKQFEAIGDFLSENPDVDLENGKIANKQKNIFESTMKKVDANIIAAINEDVKGLIFEQDGLRGGLLIEIRRLNTDWGINEASALIHEKAAALDINRFTDISYIDTIRKFQEMSNDQIADYLRHEIAGRTTLPPNFSVENLLPSTPKSVVVHNTSGYSSNDRNYINIFLSDKDDKDVEYYAEFLFHRLHQAGYETQQAYNCLNNFPKIREFLTLNDQATLNKGEISQAISEKFYQKELDAEALEKLQKYPLPEPIVTHWGNIHYNCNALYYLGFKTVLGSAEALEIIKNKLVNNEHKLSSKNINLVLEKYLEEAILTNKEKEQVRDIISQGRQTEPAEIVAPVHEAKNKQQIL